MLKVMVVHTGITVAITLLLTASLQATAAPSACKGEAKLSGTLQTEKGSIKFTNKPVELSAAHCIDVDKKDQGGCVSMYQVSTKGSEGCRLQMTLVRHPTDDIFEVRSLEFTTDSYCRGWLDPVEGPYRTEAGEFTVRAPKQVNKGQEILGTACFNAQLTVKGEAHFIHRYIQRAKQPSNMGSFKFRVSGVVQSQGAVNRPCLRRQPKVAKMKAKLIPKQQLRAAQPDPPKIIRLDFGLGGNTRGLSYSLRMSFGSSFTAIVGTGSYYSAGVGYVVRGAGGVEFHPRLTVANARSRNTIKFKSGATLRLFLADKVGLHLDGSTSLLGDFVQGSLGLSLAF
jgi:hypothetical protein